MSEYTSHLLVKGATPVQIIDAMRVSNTDCIVADDQIYSSWVPVITTNPQVLIPLGNVLDFRCSEYDDEWSIELLNSSKWCSSKWCSSHPDKNASNVIADVIGCKSEDFEIGINPWDFGEEFKIPLLHMWDTNIHIIPGQHLGSEVA